MIQAEETQQPLSTDFPTGDIESFISEMQLPKQDMNISETDGLDTLIPPDAPAPEEEPQPMKARAARASGRLVATVIDSTLPEILGYIAREPSAPYRADEESRRDLEEALAAYMQLKGGDIPPGMMVFILIITIYCTKIPAALSRRRVNLEREELEAMRRDIEERERTVKEREDRAAARKKEEREDG